MSAICLCLFNTTFIELDDFDALLALPCSISKERISEAERISSSVEIKKTEFARM